MITEKATGQGTRHARKTKDATIYLSRERGRKIAGGKEVGAGAGKGKRLGNCWTKDITQHPLYNGPGIIIRKSYGSLNR